jgi:hypothetical protein
VSFARPQWLLGALLLLVLFAWLYRTLEKRREGQALAYSNLDFAVDAMRPARWPSAVLFAAWLSGAGVLALAAAGPRFTARVPAKEATVVICIDTRRRSQAEPFRCGEGGGAFLHRCGSPRHARRARHLLERRERGPVAERRSRCGA